MHCRWKDILVTKPLTNNSFQHGFGLASLAAGHRVPRASERTSEEGREADIEFPATYQKSPIEEEGDATPRERAREGSRW